MFKIINNWWEGICNGCGMCCHEKEFSENDVVFINLEKPCPYLDKENNRCKIYNNRFKENEHCKKINIFQALFNPYLPSSCGYVKRLRFWKRNNNG